MTLPDRKLSIQQLVRENQELLEKRPHLESGVLDLKAKSFELSNSLEGTSNVVDAYSQRVKEIRGVLLKVFDASRRYGWDWNMLTDGQSQQTLPEFIPENLTAEEAIAFFVKFNGDQGQTLPEYRDRIGFEQMQFPNLSDVTGNLFPCAPVAADSTAQKMAPNSCDSCRVRLLPVTAPVLPQYRDTLLSCSVCKLRFHLCCVEPPQKEPPVDEIWKCSFCVQGSSMAHMPSTNSGSNRLPTSKSKKEPVASGSAACALVDMEVDDDLPEILAEVKPTRKRNFSTASTSSATVRRARQARGADFPAPAPSISTTMNLPETRKLLEELLGAQPEVPQELLDAQSLTSADDVALRAFVYNNVGDEAREQMCRVGMWRIMRNVPPKAEPADVLAMLNEGASIGFGKFSEAFEDPSHITKEAMADFFAKCERASADPSGSGCGGGTSSMQDATHSYDAADEDEMGEESDEVLSAAPTSGRRRLSCSSGSVSKSNSVAKCSSSLKPERQPSRWDGDLYKPFWTRGYGKAKEGWCGLCEPGTWLKTKTSVYWYHMHNFHGITSIAGDFFAPPVEVRKSGESGLREALCHQCKKWIPTQGDKPVNVEEIYWFKHSQKCHRYDNGAGDADE